MKYLNRWRELLFPIITLFIILSLSVALTGCGTTMETLDEVMESAEVLLEEVPEEPALDPEEAYTSKEDVALYLHLYGELPSNFITKSEADDLGWQASEGNLWEVTDQKSIGGDRFGNREGLLPKKSGRQYYESDINYEGGYRGAERIVYSNDGLVYYTPDHYESFELLYGEE